jgi:hypothetical protein
MKTLMEHACRNGCGKSIIGKAFIRKACLQSGRAVRPSAQKARSGHPLQKNTLENFEQLPAFPVSGLNYLEPERFSDVSVWPP